MLEEKRKGYEDTVIIGVDILPGHSPSSTRQPHYAMAVIKGGRVIDKYEDISLSRLLRLVWEYRPSIIAIDNVYELAPSDHKLAKLLTLLPPETSIVQVTGWGNSLSSLRSIARDMGVDIEGKPTPLKTAILSALIAWKGYGYRVRLLEEKTKIIVSRGRSVSHGGMSYGRYIRSVRSGILAVAKEIKRILDRNKLDYDLLFKKAKGGLERAVFTVYAPREKLYGLIKPINTKSVRVMIKPVYKSRIVIGDGVAKRSRPVIVGIDPGINTGIAILDLNGNPLFIHSSKNMDRGDIINMISSIGFPVVIATDVMDAPEAVKKLASSLKAQLYIPPRNLSTAEKVEIVSSLLKRYPWLSVENSHERDALAAAYKAYLSLEDKFRQIEKNLSRYGISLNEDRIKVAIIKGKTFAEAVEEELERIIEEQEIPAAQQDSVAELPRDARTRDQEERRSNEVYERIKVLEAEKKRLELLVKKLRSEVESLEVELRSIKALKEPNQNLLREIERLKLENKALRGEIAELRSTIARLAKENKELREALRTVIIKDFVYAPVLRTLTQTTVLEAFKKYRNAIRAVYVLGNIDDSAIDVLEKERIAILVDNPDKALAKRVPVVNVSAYEHYVVGDVVAVDPLVVREINNQWKRLEEERKRNELERVIRLIEEYKEARKKKLGLKDELSRL